MRLVEAGETVEVTDRGRPVALLVPVPAGTPIEELRASGELTLPRRRLDDLAAPRAVTGKETPSRVLSRLRRHER